jgi:hypothetical protein
VQSTLFTLAPFQPKGREHKRTEEYSSERCPFLIRRNRKNENGVKKLTSTNPVLIKPMSG